VILLVSGATVTVRRHSSVGELIEPRGGHDPDCLKLIPGAWAMDNGGYSGFEAERFVAMLEKFHGRRGCRFVASPDVVADAHATLTRWPFWSAVIRGVGFPPALVLQDGMTAADVPWREVAAVFVGGSTEWKLGPVASNLVAIAKGRGLWVHYGRVNSAKRIWWIARNGADSFDGSRNSWFPDIKIPHSIASIDATTQQGVLL
jgi:hypothetical protein